MYTIIREFGTFYKDAVALLGEDGYDELIVTLAENPEAGVIMPGTGGFRKLRFRRAGTGKSGGVRTIYFFYDESMPISLVSIFGKNQKPNLSKAELNELKQLSALLKGE